MVPFYEKVHEQLTVSSTQGMNFPAHFHDNLELYFPLDSGLTVMAGGVSRDLNAGDLALLFPNVVHGYRSPAPSSDGRCSRALLVICPLSLTGDFYRALSSFQPEDPFLSGGCLHTDAVYALRALSVPEEERNPLADRALVQLILARTMPLLKLRKNGPAPTLLQRVVQSLSERYREPLTLGRLAGDLGVSRSHLSRVFSEQLQCGFNDYLNRLRLADAGELLGSSDLTITEIGFSCGFDSPRTFNRAFRKVYGASPREFRNRGK